MSQRDSNSEKPSSSSQKKAATIKIAASEASQRTASGGADPGPGDLNAAPSVAPELVEIPEPPTASQLVVKSGSRPQPTMTNLQTLNEGRSGTLPSSQAPKSTSAAKSVGPAASQLGSSSGPAASQKSTTNGGAAREPTSSRPLSKPAGLQSSKSVSAGGGGGSGPKSSGGGPKSSGGLKSGGGSHMGSGGPPTPPSPSAAEGSGGGASGAGASEGPSGGVSNLEPKSQSGKPTSASGGGASAQEPKSQGKSQGPEPTGSGPAQPSSSPASPAEGGVEHVEDEEGEGEVENPVTTSPAPSVSPASSAAGGSHKSLAKSSAASSPAASTSSLKSGKSGKSSSPASSSVMSEKSGHSGHFGGGTKGKKNKVTKFRYHKRITVRTHGKTSPKAIMEKVNKKDHKAGITPSTIEDMDPQELMKRAGIKGTNKTHWRVRLRQTKRLTKNGKTTTQTKVAYRDSEGNKRVKTSSSPDCKKCGKKLEQCNCDSSSQS